jgi:DNA (cytosine-5)-methyltransferase 1
MKALELFSGAGGLAMGLHLAGFDSVAVIEWDKWACDTIRENQRRAFPLVKNWPLFEMDVRDFDFSTIPEDLDLVAGGPPCQPFSLGGKHRAHKDQRNMFPPMVDAIRRVRPKAFIIENVKGLTRSSFANYYTYILHQCAFPDVTRKEGETWLGHLARLEREKTSGRRTGLTYEVVTRVVNAADYGVPQRRERVFIVGFRSDLGIQWNFPETTHNLDALLVDQWITGTYWERHNLKRPVMPATLSGRVARLKKMDTPPRGHPWRTVREALARLPDPREQAELYRDHQFQAGARTYPGHTGSPLDLPAKTLKAGDHGVPGGENMMIMDNGKVRYFTVRESARIQTFPDGYVFHGSWTEAMRQLGNAVPLVLARVIAASVAEQLVMVKMARIITQKNKHASLRVIRSRGAA